MAKSIEPVYLLFGAETLLVQEVADQLRSYLADNGYGERICHTVGVGFDWNCLIGQGQTMSLFSEKKMIQLRMPTGRPGTAGTKTLMDYLDRLSGTDTVLIVISGSIEKRAQNSKWIKAIDKSGVIIDCPAVSAPHLPEWISRRMQAQGLRFDREVVHRLAHYVEGNLLAAAQEINLLALLYPQQMITLQMIERVSADHARFNVFSFVDACLTGSLQRSLRILHSLRREQVEPIIILWALARDIRTLYHLCSARENGLKPASLFRQYGVWSSRSGLMQSALTHLSVASCFNLMKKMGRIDLMIKGQAPLQKQNIWEEIEGVAIGLCGLRLQ